MQYRKHSQKKHESAQPWMSLFGGRVDMEEKRIEEKGKRKEGVCVCVC